MFDALKNFGQLPGLMAKAQRLQEEMKKMQEEMAHRRVSADAGGGRVTATVNGRLELISIHIDPTRVDTANTDLLENLVTAAVCSAQFQAAKVVREKMEKVAAELGITPDMLPGASV